jgi:hypothetical protein
MKKIMFNDKFGLTQAVLDGRKTMTRRISEDQIRNSIFCKSGYESIHGYEIKPKYKVGEVVAIAQSYESVYHECGLETMDMLVSSLKYNAGWTNKMFVKADLMPHHIEITNIKIERLQDISDEDCLKEGIIHVSTFLGQKIYHTPHVNGSYLSTNVAQEAFAYLIDKVSGKGTWEENPFVWVYEFKLFD